MFGDKYDTILFVRRRDGEPLPLEPMTLGDYCEEFGDTRAWVPVSVTLDGEASLPENLGSVLSYVALPRKLLAGDLGRELIEAVKDLVWAACLEEEAGVCAAS